MHRRKVDSSVIATVGHDPAQNILEIEFCNGRLYHYFLVPRSVYEGLLAAPSLGAYFNLEIRPRFHAEEIATG